MAATYSEDYQAKLIEKLRKQKAYIFLTKVIREAVLRMLDVGRPYPMLNDNDLIARSLVYHWLKDCCLDATAELLQAETYERLLTVDQLTVFVSTFTIESLSDHFRNYPVKQGTKLPRETWTQAQDQQPFDRRAALDAIDPLFDGKLPDDKQHFVYPIERKSENRSVEIEEISPNIDGSVPSSPILSRVADGRASSAPSKSPNSSLNESLLQSMSNLKKTIQPNPGSPSTSSITATRQVDPIKQALVVTSSSSSTVSSPPDEGPGAGSTSWFTRSSLSSAAPISKEPPIMATAMKSSSSSGGLPPLGGLPSISSGLPPLTGLPPVQRSSQALRSLAALDFGENKGSPSSSPSSASSAKSSKGVMSSAHSSQPLEESPIQSSKSRKSEKSKTPDKLASREESRDEEVEVDEDLAEMDVDDLLQSDRASSISF